MDIKKEFCLIDNANEIGNAAERQLLTIVQTTPECIKIVARDGTLLQMNQSGLKMIGAQTEEEVKGTCVFDLIAPEYREQWKLNHERICQGESLSWQFEIANLEGNSLWLETNAVPFTLPHGEVAHLAITRNITEQKHIEKNNLFLTEASRVFANSLDFNETVKALGQLVVPHLADWYIIELLNEAGALENIHVSHRDQEKLKLALEMRKKFPSRPEAPVGTYQAVHTGKYQLINEIPEGLFDKSAHTREHASMLRSLGIRSFLIVPLKVRERIIGVMTLCQSESKRTFSEFDLKNILDLANRASLAIENSKLYTSVQDEQSKLKLAIEATKMGVFDWEINSQKLYWSDRTLEIFGFKKGEFKGTYEEYIERLHPDDRALTKKTVEEALANKKDYSVEHRILLPDSTVRWALGSGHAFYDKSGNPIRIAGTVKDITWRKEAEINQAKVTQLQQIVTHLTHKNEPYEIAETIISRGLSPIEADAGSFLIRNEITGDLTVIYSEGEIKEDFKIGSVIPAQSERPTVQAVRSGKPVVFETPLHFTIVANPLVIHGQCLGVLKFNFNNQQVITPALLEYIQTLSDHAAQAIERVMSFKEAQEARKKADKANAAKSAFLANMSHEIRTPMNAILGFAKLLKDNSVTEDERIEYLKRIEVNGDHLMHLIDDILDLSRIEAGQMRIEKDTFSVQDLMKDIHESLNVLVKDKNIQTRLEFNGSLPEAIVSDYVRVKQVLMNLTGNAAKFTKSGSILLRVEAIDKNRYLQIDVEDTGVGIASEIQSSLFKPFSQGDESITRRFGGTGLGLVLSRRICEAFGGDLSLVRSEKDQGSLFRARLPLIVGTAQHPIAHIESAHNSFVFKPNFKILLAEDSQDNQTLIKIYLRHTGCQLQVANDGQQAVDLALQENFDVILMDIQMPGKDGLQATRELRANGYKGPIIALTAHALPEEINRSLLAGCNAHLTKPISRTVLIEEISKLSESSNSDFRKKAEHLTTVV